MGRIIIDNEKCKSCLICAEICPKKLIKKSNCVNSCGYCFVEFIDEAEQCSGCALCAESCPDMAISEVYR